jgi:hypothetical protein
MLKGYALHDKANQLRELGYTTREIVVECGYGRENRVPNYTKFYEESIRIRAFLEAASVRDFTQQNPGSKILGSICDAIANDYHFEKGSDSVHDGNFYYHGELIVRKVSANYTQGPQIRLFVPSKLSKSTKARANAILRRLAGFSVFQKAGKWYISRPMLDDIPYTDGMVIYIPRWFE